MEIAKSILLLGVKKVTLVDDKLTEESDKNKNWYFKSSYTNKKRSQAYLPDLQALNPFVEVLSEPMSCLENISIIKNTDIVVLCGELNLEFIQSLNQRCRENRSGFILSNCIGFFGLIFVDFPNHKVYDKHYSGFNNQFYIRNITNEKEGRVTISAMAPHFLMDGDFVSISEVEGMNEVNGPEVRPIKVIDKYNFTIENTTNFAKYKSGGIVTYTRVAVRVNFSSFKENLQNPQFAHKSLNSFYNQIDMHVAMLIYSDLVEKRKFDPELNDFESLEKRIDSYVLDVIENNEMLLELFRTKNVENFKVVGVLKEILRYEKVEMTPITKLIAGFSAFQVIVGSGKFYPINQLLYFHFNDEFPRDLMNCYRDSPSEPLRLYYDQFSNENPNIKDYSNLR